MCVIVLGGTKFSIFHRTKNTLDLSRQRAFSIPIFASFFSLADWIFLASFLMDVYESLFVQYFYVTEDDITQLTSPTPGGPNFPGCPTARTQMTRGRDWDWGGEDPKENIIISTPSP